MQHIGAVEVGDGDAQRKQPPTSLRDEMNSGRRWAASGRTWGAVRGYYAMREVMMVVVMMMVMMLLLLMMTKDEGSAEGAALQRRWRRSGAVRQATRAGGRLWIWSRSKFRLQDGWGACGRHWWQARVGLENVEERGTEWCVVAVWVCLLWFGQCDASR